MKYYLLVLFVAFSSIAVWGEDYSFSELESVDSFQVCQQKYKRRFDLIIEDRCVGSVLNTFFGVFEFYNQDKNRLFINRYDDLFDEDESTVGIVRVNSTWLGGLTWSSSIELFSGIDGTALGTLESQPDGRTFIFFDAESKQPLVTAIWEEKYCEDSLLNRLIWHDKYQLWSVQVMDRPRLEEKNISNVLLTWIVLKHSQKYLPAYPYQTTP